MIVQGGESLGQHRPGKSVTWKGRLFTAIAMPQLLLAIVLVHFVPMRFWRGHLGALATGPIRSPPAISDTQFKDARRRAWHVARAADHLPFTVKCLPQAMVLQWQLRRRGIGSLLAIARHKGQHSDEADIYHAWVELDGTMVLGICERPDYAVLMTFSNDPG